MCAHDVGSNEKLFYKEFLAKIAFVWRGWVGAMPRLQQAGRDGEVVGGAVELALARLLALVQPPGHSAPEYYIVILDTSRVNSRSLESRLAKTANLLGRFLLGPLSTYCFAVHPVRLIMHCAILSMSLSTTILTAPVSPERQGRMRIAAAGVSIGSLLFARLYTD